MKAIKFLLILTPLLFCQCVRLLYTEAAVPHKKLYTPVTIFKAKNCIYDNVYYIGFVIPYRGTYQLTAYFNNSEDLISKGIKESVLLNIILKGKGKDINVTKKIVIQSFPRSKVIYYLEVPQAFHLGKIIQAKLILKSHTKTNELCEFDFRLDIKRIHPFFR